MRSRFCICPTATFILASVALPLSVATCATATAPVPSYLKGYEDLYGKDPHAAAIAWFEDAEFGLFVHYALPSVLEGGKPELLRRAEQENVDVGLLELSPAAWAEAGLSKEEMERHRAFRQNLLERFDAKNFDADAICELAVAAGMRYVTFTTKHLGGLRLYRTKTTDFTSLNSPARRDLVAEMAAACKRRGLGLFLYVPPEAARTDKAHRVHNLTVLRELLTRYGPIAGIWFDGIGQDYRNPENYTRLSETYALVRSLQPQCLISFKEGALGEEDFRTPEHFLLPAPVEWDTPERQERWNVRLKRWKKNSADRSQRAFQAKRAEINTTMQVCRNRDGVGEPGGWINDENARHLTADEVMFLLKIARSLKANLLVNVGPRGDGSIHPEDSKTLTEVGRRIRRDGFPR